MLYVIICANFGMEKLRGLGNTRGQILVSPIEMAGHPYNSAALPRTCNGKSDPSPDKLRTKNTSVRHMRLQKS